MPELKKLLESTMKVRFHDCDPFNHLNNSRYLDYIITARGDQLIEQYNLDIYHMANAEGVGWVAAQTQIAYAEPAQLMEEVLIQTQLLSFSRKSVQVEGSMWSSNKTALKALMWTTLVHVNVQTQKSHAHSEELLALFAQVVNPLPDQTGFDGRLKALRQRV